MSDYIVLLGAEDVSRAATAMRSAAEEMQRAASAIDYTAQAQQRFMDDWLQGFAALLEGQEP